MNRSRIELALVFENLGIPKNDLTTFSKYGSWSDH